jgi:hypothetical protein
VAFSNSRSPHEYQFATDTLARIADHKINKLDELMPWRYAQN